MVKTEFSKNSMLTLGWCSLITSGQFFYNNFYLFHHILSCTTSEHPDKKNVWQSNCTIWPSFAPQNMFDKLNRFLRYRHIKMRQWWNAEFHRFCILIWWYLKNIFSLSRTFCWAKLGQSVWLNCPIFLLAECLLVSAVRDKMWQKKWKSLRENCPNVNVN